MAGGSLAERDDAHQHGAVVMTHYRRAHSADALDDRTSVMDRGG